MSARRMKARKRGKRGFTIVEVIVSMGVMVIGVMAIVGLQTQTVAINGLARQMSTANQIAQTWIERMKEDAHRWSLVGVVGGTPSLITVLQQTQWLQAANLNPDVFQTVPMAALTSGAFDYQGNEILLGTNGTPFFCVGYRPSWMYPGRAVRVDVRVFWPRERAAAIVNCVDTNAPLNPGGALFNQFHTVYLSTVIRHSLVTR